MTEISHRCYKDDLKGDVPPTERMIIFLSCSQDSEVRELEMDSEAANNMFY